MTGLELLLLSTLVVQQSHPGAPHAVEVITPAEIARYVQVLAADSMRGRDTPSPALERTAQYIKAEWQRFGLQPYYDDERAWFQRYPVPEHLHLDYARSQVRVAVHDSSGGRRRNGKPTYVAQGAADLATTAYFTTEVVPPVVRVTVRLGISSIKELARPLLLWGAPPVGSDQTVLIAGRHTVASVPAAAIQNKVVLYVPPVGEPASVRQQVLAHLAAASRGVVLVSDEDSASFATRVRGGLSQPPTLVDLYPQDSQDVRPLPWAVTVWPGTITKVLAAAGVDLAAVRAAPTPVIRELPSMAIWLEPNLDTTGQQLHTAPNVIGVLEGADSILKKEYIVLSTHMDASGGRPGDPDSIPHGANDNASGIAGLLALANAFSQPGERPRRSIVFLATSGAVKEFWGSRFAAEGGLGDSYWFGKIWPDERGPRIVASITLDRVGNLNRDSSITVDGLSDVELETPPTWMATMHPELGLIVRDGGTAVQSQSDHFPFTRRGVPSLLFHNDVHAGKTQKPDPGNVIEAEQEAHILRLVFYVIEGIANSGRTPSLSMAGRRRIFAPSAP